MEETKTARIYISPGAAAAVQILDAPLTVDTNGFIFRSPEEWDRAGPAIDTGLAVVETKSGNVYILTAEEYNSSYEKSLAEEEAKALADPAPPAPPTSDLARRLLRAPASSRAPRTFIPMEDDNDIPM